MKSVLKELEEKYYLIMKTNNNELTKTIAFSDDINYAFESLMQIINTAYAKNKKPKKPIRVFLKKTRTGKCYLKVIGRDRNTRLIIRPNFSNYSDFLGIEGYKVTESELAKTLDVIQRDKLEKSGVSKRFIKEIIPEIDLYVEMEIEKIINSCKEIYIKQNQPVSTEYYEEPENNQPRKKRNPKEKESNTIERMNPIIPYEIRKQELTKYGQKEIIRFQGKKTSILFDAYIYIKHGFILAIIEPLSGIGYQYNLNLGFAEDYNEDRIRKMIKAALEAEEYLVMEDDAMIRKNHTTLDNFKNNIDIFLNNKDYNKRFAAQTEIAAKVYQKVKKNN